MALKPNNTAVAIKHQVAAGTFSSPSATTDGMPVSNLSMSIDGVVIANDEYTGSITKNGDELVGRNVTLSYRVKIRPPGGADVPGVGAYIPGRILVAAKFTELRTTTAIPSSPAALGTGSTTTRAVLGSDAAATGDLYKGLALILSDNGANYKQQLTMISGYDASRNAALPEVLGAIPAANWQIPKQLTYLRSITPTDPPFTSHRVWIDGHRYDLVDCTVTSLRFNFPVSTREQGQYCEIEVSWSATISGDADEATPAVTPLGPVPKFKDGDLWLAYRAIGGSNVTIDLGLQVGYPPNPNKVEGNDPGELIEARASATVDRHHYLKAGLDALALAEAQAVQPLFLQYGYTAGNVVQALIPDARLNYASPNLGGQFVTDTQPLFIDALDRAVVLNFPY